MVRLFYLVQEGSNVLARQKNSGDPVVVAEEKLPQALDHYRRCLRLSLGELVPMGLDEYFETYTLPQLLAKGRVRIESTRLLRSLEEREAQAAAERGDQEPIEVPA